MKHTQLKHNCLGFRELLAQNIAVISPTMTAALIVPVMYGTSGEWSWLSYALGAVMLLFVAFNLNQFAKRSSSTGSMYAYISRSLGLTAGGIGGWSLIWAYLGIAMAGITGFSVFAKILLSMVGITVPTILLFAIGASFAWFLAWKDIRLSQLFTFILEGVSVLLITILCIIVLGEHHFIIDTAQFNFQKFDVSNLGLGMVIAIFSLVGFESATSLGDEAKSPLKNIPRAVLWSLISAGAFFVFVTYVTIIGTQGYSQPLAQISAPLNVMAQLANVGLLSIPISFGAMASFFALSLSCINAGSRVMYAMSRHGIISSKINKVHEINATPHFAVNIMAAIAFIVPTALVILTHQSAFTIFGWVGTIAAYGFLVAYILVTFGATVYLKKIGELRGKDRVIQGIALVLLMIPAIGSVYPVPQSPVNYFPYLFLAYLIMGTILNLLYHRRNPSAANRIRMDLDKSHAPLTETE